LSHQRDEFCGTVDQLVGKLLIIGNSVLHVNVKKVLVQHIVLPQLVSVLTKEKKKNDR